MIIVIKIVQHGCADDYRVSDYAEPVRDLTQDYQSEKCGEDYR